MSGEQCGKIYLLFAVLNLLSLFFTAPYSHASDKVIVKVYLNTEDKGERFVLLTPEGDALFLREDLLEMGFKEISRDSETSIEGKNYVSLRSYAPEVTFEIAEREAALRITSAPKLLEKNVADLAHKKPSDVLYTKESTAFLNYSLGYSMGDDFDFAALNVPWEVGVNAGGYLGFSGFAYTKTDADEKFVRLFSNVTGDDRVKLRRIVLGDFPAFSGALGSGGILGGLSISSNFSVRPFFVRSPGLDLSGVLETPSKVDLYINDILVRSEHIPAGEFQFLNVPGTGSGDAVLVVKDVFGSEKRIAAPFYLSTQLLKPGLHDYSYNFGFRREKLGQESFKYGDPAFVGFHRFGFSGIFTAGMRAEADRHVVNFGPTATFVPWRLGETNVSLAVSSGDGHNGYGASLSHFYAGRNISGGVALRGYSREYANLGLSSSLDKLRLDRTFSLGINQKNFGSISVLYSHADFHTAADRWRASLFYTRRLLHNISLHARASRTYSEEAVDEVFAGLSFFLGTGRSGSLNYQVQDGRATETASLQQNPPLGTGVGYRFLADRSEDQTGDRNIGGNAFFEYHGRYGIYSADYRRISENDLYDLNVAGGVAFINKSLYFTRPIRDSFALVKVGDLGGVKVNYSNQEVGTTNKNGEVIVPNLISYYYNDLSLEDKDIPVNYKIAETRKYVSPPVRGGGIVKFQVMKTQGFTGRLFIVEKGEKKAAEYWGLKIWVDGKPMEVIVGKAGEFYLENIPAGRFPATLFRQDSACSYHMIFPESNEIMVYMDEATCEMD